MYTEDLEQTPIGPVLAASVAVSSYELCSVLQPLWLLSSFITFIFIYLYECVSAKSVQVLTEARSGW